MCSDSVLGTRSLNPITEKRERVFARESLGEFLHEKSNPKLLLPGKVSQAEGKFEFNYFHIILLDYRVP